jgi:4-hydroxythreonine-4-phosphate dehydrogenase
MTLPALPLAITSGEPAGIGPDICLQLSQHAFDAEFVIIGDKLLLQQRAAQLGLNVQFHDYAPQLTTCLPAGNLTVLHMPVKGEVHTGRLNPANSSYVLDTLIRSVQGCVKGEFSGIVTAPVHKGVINESGISFTGHTEFFAENLNASKVVMMLVGGNMRVALATTHLPLSEVPNAITPTLLENTLRTIQHDFALRFGIPKPRILVAGLNPHAGEGGHLGREEIEVMIPVLDKLRTENINVSMPLPADSLFTQQRLSQCDCVLSMYHDQGLPVLKHASFGQGVNVTLGLPIIRTSVDHGTALDLAGSGRADAGSLIAAIRLAADMVRCEQLAV